MPRTQETKWKQKTNTIKSLGMNTKVSKEKMKIVRKHFKKC